MSDDEEFPPVLRGFELIENFITVDEEAALIESITKGSTIPDRKSVRIEERRKRKYEDPELRSSLYHNRPVEADTTVSKYYGYAGLTPMGILRFAQPPSVVKRPPLPDYLTSLGEKVTGSLKFDFNSTVVIQYAPNIGIIPHFDLFTYIDAIIGVSLGQDVEMSFLHRNYGFSSETKVLIPRRSVYIMKNEAMNDWRHGIADDQCDGRRISITFRKCNLKLLVN